MDGGLSVFNQCDTKQYFSISTINPERMKFYGLNMSIRQLQEKARKSSNYLQIPTGKRDDEKHQRMTKIYRYADFKE